MDPRDYPSARDWYNDSASWATTEGEIDRIIWEDICARLGAKDADLAEAREGLELLRGAVDVWAKSFEWAHPVWKARPGNRTLFNIAVAMAADEARSTINPNDEETK